MYIEPKTNIKLLSNVPLDTTYEHTLSWEKDSTGVIAQNTYFVGQTKYNLTDYNYVRVANGVARVGIPAENLYDCNYMMFQNTAFGNKWFYAFVTDIIYLNNGTTEIRFTIDDLQTWYFNFELDDCFIEREHTATDVIGEHIEPEPVSVGEYVMTNQELISGITYAMAIIVAVANTTQEAQGGYYDHTYSGVRLYAFALQECATAFLKQYVATPDNVVNIYMCPLEFLPDGTDYNLSVESIESNIVTPIPSTDRGGYNIYPTVNNSTNKLTSLDGYTDIRNNKLWTYPYNLYCVTGGDSTLQLRYEFFENRIVRLKGYSTVTAPISLTAYPHHYKGVYTDETNVDGIYMNESISLASYPSCSWNMDAYKVFLAQNNIPILLNGIAQIGSTAIQARTNMAGAVTGGLNYAMNLLSQNYSASIQADIYKGNFSTGCNASANLHNNLYGGQMCITHQQAKIIDDFFTKYGYAVNVVKKPDWRSRPHYNYIKTVNCTATGSIPSDAMRNICHLFDNGITFWKVPAEVGQYNSVDNRV